MLRTLLFSLFTSTLVAAPALKVGLVLDKGGRDDKSFNSAAFKGASEAEKAFGIQLKIVEASDDAAISPSLKSFAQRGYDLIIGIGFSMASSITQVATEFPKLKFLLVDAPSTAPNVKSIIFNEHEGSYLVGVIAALTTKTKTVGFIGGMDVPLIRRFEMGYRAGVESVDPKIKVLTNFVGSTSDAWRNPTKGKELAISQYKREADITFLAAGASALGAFDAAEELKKFVIGVDSNQNWVKPGRVLTSMLKRVDLAVFQTIEATTKGNFSGGHSTVGFAEGMVDYALDEYNRPLISASVEKKATEVKEKIKSGKIKVPDYYERNRGTASKAAG